MNMRMKKNVVMMKKRLELRVVSSMLIAGILMMMKVAVLLAPAVSGQLPFGSCTTSMIASMAPCMSYLTGGGSGSPTQDCCKSLADLVSSSSDCACFLVTGGLPSSLNVNRSLAVSLPQFCSSRSAPLFQCKASSGAALPPAVSGFNPFASFTPPSFPNNPPGSVQAASPSEPPPPPPAAATPSDGGVKPLLLPNAAAVGFQVMSAALVSVAISAATALTLIDDATRGST